MTIDEGPTMFGQTFEDMSNNPRQMSSNLGLSQLFEN